jgi:hypothetical protein
VTPLLRPEPTVPVDLAPGRLRLVLAPRPVPGGVDGRWWPRTRDLAVELPALVAAVAQQFGAVDRVGLDPEAWDGRPRRAVVGGRVVALDWFGGGGRHAIELFGPHATHVVLLVIPPDAPLIVALACLAMQASTAPAGGDPSSAGVTEADRGWESRWEDDGGRPREPATHIEHDAKEDRCTLASTSSSAGRTWSRTASPAWRSRTAAPSRPRTGTGA